LADVSSTVVPVRVSARLLRLSAVVKSNSPDSDSGPVPPVMAIRTLLLAAVV